ncbi:MAG: copper resistance CopC/CopD family protein [Actinomycetota bacterium]
MNKVAAGVIASAFLLAGAAPVYAHARLVSTVPAGGSTVTEAPTEIVLQFSERIESSFGGVQVFDPAGERVRSAEPVIVGQTVNVALPELPGPGDYTVAFRIISGDSHPVESRFAFSFQPPGGPLDPAPPVLPPGPEASIIPPGPAEPGPQPLDVELQDAGPLSSAGLWLARLLNYLAATLVVGSLVAGAYLLRGDSERVRVFGWAARLSIAWALTGGLLFLFGFSVAAALPLGEAIGVSGRLLGTRFGQAVALQVGAALAVAATAAFARKGPSKVPVAALAAASIGLLAPGLWGHASTAPGPVFALASDWAHLVSVTAWVGGLAVLAATVLRPGSVIDPIEPSKRFSKLAGVALAVVLLTGTINALSRIGTMEELLDTEWGKLVLIKLVLFGAIVMLGYRNRTRMFPAIAREEPGGRKAFRKLAVVELGVMVLSFAAATALASTIPADAEAAAALQSITAPFGEGGINLTVEPAKVGNNLMHLYFLDATGRPQVVSDASLTLSRNGISLQARMFESGPGHYTVLEQPIGQAGEYSVTISAAINGLEQTATSALAIR